MVGLKGALKRMKKKSGIKREIVIYLDALPLQTRIVIKHIAEKFEEIAEKKIFNRRDKLISYNFELLHKIEHMFFSDYEYIYQVLSVILGICPVCNEDISDGDLMRKTVKSERIYLSDKRIGVDESEKIYLCDICQSEFSIGLLEPEELIELWKYCNSKE